MRHSEPVRTPPCHWRPTLGAWVEGQGVRFRVWAPETPRLEVVLEAPEQRVIPLTRFQDGTFGGWVEGIGAGARYKYRLAEGEFPDPATRFQPEGVHGPSEVIDPGHFAWNDDGWKGIGLDELIIYELHVGTFSPEGTYEGVIARLPYLKRLGITALELMPVADFPGARNWGYDGVHPYAPARCYGSPDDLRRLVDAAHGIGLAVFLDVVYNHLGPEGNYLPTFSPHYFSKTHTNPWGQSLNFDDEHSTMARQFFIENALHWVHEYHIDGLRLDATHAIIDDSARPFLADLAARVHESTPLRNVLLVAEDHRNLSHMIQPEGKGGWGLDGVWADDFHHIVRVALAHDHEGYYGDFKGSTQELAETLNTGWLYQGQYAEYLQEHRGTDPSGIPPRRFVVCIQNHDQIGNRAFGERLNHQIDPSAYRAASALLLTAPQTPMLFMGQEWGSRSPFQYFTDHPEELGKLVTEGRRQEFRHFSAFDDPAARERIPDPQAPSTFENSRLNWDEIGQEPHASTVRLHQTLLNLRRSEPALKASAIGRSKAFALSDTTLAVRRDPDEGPSLLVLVQLEGGAEIDLNGQPILEGLDGARCQVVLTTEDAPFTNESQPTVVELSASAPRIQFARPSAVLLRAWPTTKLS